MEFFQHFITADIKYNFWSDEDGHQFREDWVKCRLNINYIDSPKIEIKCRALNLHTDIPLQAIIDFNDFHFERLDEVDGTKKNVFAITWRPQITENNEFFIAIDDRVQFDNYGTYLNNMIKICRIAEDERSEEHYDDYSSTSFYDLSNSSLSLFSISAFGVIDRSLATEMVQEKMAAQAKDRRFRGISRVKRATKSVAKKLNRILLRTKTKLKTQKTAAATNAASNEIFGLEQPIDDNDIGIIRSERVDDDIDMIENERIADPTAVAVANDNVTEVDLNKTSTSSLHFIESSPFAVDECVWQITEDDSGDSCIGSSYEDCLSSIGSSPSLDQSPCDKSSYGSLEECMSSDAPSLVSIIINRSQSRSPIVFRPDFYVKKTDTTADTPNGQHHKQHTLYQVSNDNHSAIDDYTSLIERINARKQQIESDLKIESEIKTKSKKLSQIISKLGAPSKYTRKLSSIIWSANIINVTQKFLNYVSIV